jgi:hypothetical protein
LATNGILYYAASCSGGYCINAADPTTGDVLWTSSEHFGSLRRRSPFDAIYIADGSTLHRFVDGIPDDDTIFADGFDPWRRI